jgi:hypothetical protein
MELERCPGGGSLIALGHKHSGREYAACPVCRRSIELVPPPPGQASAWGIVAEHERPVADDDAAMIDDPWRHLPKGP